MTHRQTARGHLGAHFVGQLQQTKAVRDRRSVLADLDGDVFLSEPELVGEPLIRQGLFDGVEIFALDILDERHLEPALRVRGSDVLDDDGDFLEVGAFGGAPAPLSGDDLVAAGFDAAHDDRLNHPVRTNGARELLETRLVERSARLIVVGLDQIDIDVERRARRRERVGRVGDERAQSFAKGLSFFHTRYSLLPRNCT